MVREVPYAQLGPAGDCGRLDQDGSPGHLLRLRRTRLLACCRGLAGGSCRYHYLAKSSGLHGGTAEGTHLDQSRHPCLREGLVEVLRVEVLLRRQSDGDGAIGVTVNRICGQVYVHLTGADVYARCRAT
jgi:hypothetical protein